jgi:hypothetical protein
VTLDAGATEQHDLVISNRTANLRISVKLSASDATGGVGTGTSAWIAFGADVVQLDPHSSRTVPVTLSVPHDTQPGQALAHVTARVESATLASDGSPRNVVSHKTLPVSMTVNGAPTAQIAIADVHRVDNDSTHQIGIVMRNFGDQGARITGRVIVAGDHPQTHGFSAELAPRRDTTLLVPWDAPSKDVATDISVSVDYGGGDTALWSSRLGGPPVTVDTAPAADVSETPTSAAGTATTTTTDTTASAGPAQDPWWKKAAIPGIVIVAILLAGLWFVFELRSSRRRRETMPMQPPFFVVSGGSASHLASRAAAGEATVEIATDVLAGVVAEVVMRLASSVQGPHDENSIRARARSPDTDPRHTHDVRRAHYDDATPNARVDDYDDQVRVEPVTNRRPAAPTPGVESRPGSGDRRTPQATPSSLDGRAELMRRMVEIDLQRRELRARQLSQWLDGEDALDGQGNNV